MNQGRIYRLKLLWASILVTAISSPALLSSLEGRAAEGRASDSVETPNLQGLSPPGSPLTDKDCQLASFAREALLQDEILGPLNVGVTVHSGTATLWGTVPNVALSRRAEEKVRSVLGLAQVKNDLRIAVGDDETAEFLGMATWRPPAALPEKAKTRDRPIPLVSRAEESWPSSNKAAVASPPIMPLIQVLTGPQKTVSSFEPPMTQPVLKVSTVPPLVETLEQLRRSSERFRPIRVEVQGRVVRLWGNAARGEDVFTFAQRISHLPGVERVIVERSR